MITGSRAPLSLRFTGLSVWFLALCLGFSAQAATITVNVVDGAGNPVGLSGFKYILQEDSTFAVDPADPPTRDEMLSFGFHASNHPVAIDTNGSGITGSATGPTADLNNVPAGRYFVSVLPFVGSGYAMGGAPVVVDGGNAAVDVTVNAQPIPTAQITIFLFQDNWPLNGTPDLPEEENPGADEVSVDWTQFSIVLEEPAGLYGQNGGPIIQDAFGNPLGTTYDDDGNPVTFGDGTLHPDADGILTVKNLPPGKYGIIVVPPSASPAWQQTSTIEGSPVIDAWVKANEPPFFVEFGLPGPHAFIGFVQEQLSHPALDGGNTVTGTITNMHLSRPPATQMFSGQPFPGCWVALNTGGAAPGEMLYAAPCDGDSNFSIDNVPTGSYELKVFDSNLDVVIATLPLAIDAAGNCNGGACALGEVPVFGWFARLEGAVFNDDNQNGFWDDGELPIGPEAGPIGLRWRNGTVYQEFPTDGEGFAPFDEVFPFFHWLVAEVGFGNKKATGATFWVDAGGDPDPAFGDVLDPQPQTCSADDVADGVDNCATAGEGRDRTNPHTGDAFARTETGPVLTQGFQGFLGQTSIMQFGKAEYLATLLDRSTFPPTNTFIGENGGISGMVHYATTRAEDDPRFAAAETWEPGVPRVQIALYADGDIDCASLGNWPADHCDIDWNGDDIRQPNDDEIDDINDVSGIQLADVDNHPLGWAGGGAMGPEDVDNNTNANGGQTGVFDYGDALAVTWTDSWDDSLPTHCGGANQIDVDLDGAISAEEDRRCFDGLRNFNQVRPAVFDGGWAFDAYNNPHLPVHIADKLAAFYGAARATADPNNADTGAEGDTGTLADILPEAWMIPGADYIVEAATPPGYQLLKEEDKNVDFGDDYVPSPQGEDPTCVGDPREVPPYLSFVSTEGGATLLAGLDNSNGDYDAPFAGETRPLCDRKSVRLTAGQNAAANFFLFTEVPIAGNVSGVMLNDLANEFNPNTPAFGEKYAPPFAPVAFYDWAGNEVNRVYADEFGRFDLTVPSTYTVNLPFPSGMSPNMLVSCMNDAGPIPNPEFCADPNPANCPGETTQDAPEFIVDPNHNPQFSQFCYTFQYMPGAATYLDTPVVSIAAFANPPTFPLDCEQPTRTPMIASVTRLGNSAPAGAGGALAGPFVVNNSFSPQQIRIRSMGWLQVPNPDWDGVDPATKTIRRDYSFGRRRTGSVVTLTPVGGGAPIVLSSGVEVPTWAPGRIIANVPTALPPGDYQVTVTRGHQHRLVDPVESPSGVTLTVGVCESNRSSTNRRCRGTEHGVKPNADPSDGYQPDELYAIHHVAPAAYPDTPIQDAIDNADPADLVMVGPGVYDELVILWKPVKLQAWGPGAVTLNARQVPTEKINNWRTAVENLVAGGFIDLLPGQELAPGGFPALGAPLFPTEEGAAIFVAGSNQFPDWFRGLPNRGARIDGFNIVGATQGGAIVVNGYAGYLSIGNNRMSGNAGFYGGGIRVGHPTLTHQDPATDLLLYTDADSDNIRIHHNLVVKNGGINADGVGGGIGLMTGADGYQVQQNWVCGNFSVGSGAGIGHLGFSDNGLIEDNTIIFNESFSQATAESGGGLYVGGQPGLQLIDGFQVSPGTGTVSIDANLIRGNLAGAGDGGGIRIENVNGEDVVASPGASGPWDDVYVFNNMITNNVAGRAGGGVSIENTVSAWFRYNTIAHNDSTATVALAASNDPNQTLPQPAGLVSRAHSGDFADLMDLTPDVAGNDQDLFSNPELRSNIVWRNRSFFWWNFGADGTVTGTGLFPAGCTDSTLPTTCNDVYDDLAVLDVAGAQLNPVYSLLTNRAGYAANNISGNPRFVRPYFNGPRDSLNIPEFTTLQTAGAFDEAGNFIQVTFGPLSLIDSSRPPNRRMMFDYHLRATSPAIDAGSPNNAGGTLGALGDEDFDNDPRGTTNTDIGADEAQ